MTTLPPILQAVQARGYKVFTSGDYNLNITGIRSGERIANAFDDRLCVTYKVEEIWTTETYEITTDPGSPYLYKPLANTKGTAILVPGQYRGAYSIGKHRGQYLALVQTGPVQVYRDDNRDNVLNMDPSSIQRGYFGINIHKRSGDSDTVNGASAGCQVFRYQFEFERLMWLAGKQVSERGYKTFTYTLLNEEEGDW